MHLTILNLKEKIFEGKVDSITIPGVQGELTILTNHVPIITAIKRGVIGALMAKEERYEGEGKKYFDSCGGIFEFQNNEATILL